MNFFSGLKRLCHFTFSTIKGLVNNLILLTMLIFLITASVAFGIIFDHLLTYFDEGVREKSWYVINIALLWGLAVCAGSVVYLVNDILKKYTRVEIKRNQAEHKVRAQEQEYKDYVSFDPKPSILTRLLQAAKRPLLLTRKKDE